MNDHDELAARVTRLERRLEREKAARLESEAVAERSLRHLYQRQRSLDLLTRTAALANEATDADEAFTEVMEIIVQDFDFRVGHLLAAARDDPHVLVSTGLWVGEEGDPFFTEVKAGTVGARFGPGVGVPGRVMVHGPRWEDPPVSLITPRASLLSAGTVFAFGVMVESVLVAVLEFLSPVSKPRDANLMALAVPMGEQLGRVIERKRAREEAERHRAELEGTVRERTADLLRANDRAEALAHARAALFNTVTHELSTPLHAALNALDTADGATVRSQLRLLNDRLDSLLHLATDSSGEDRSAPGIIVLADLVTQVCVGQESLTAPTGGPISLTVDPTAAEEVLIDAVRLRGAMDTLIAGMRLADPGAEVAVRVHLSGREAVIAITAQGAAPDHSAREVARRLIVEAQGRLSGDTRRFELVVPVARPGLRRQGHSRRVLLVDDTKVTQRLASVMLADAGLEVDTASDGEQALNLLGDSDYGAVLMDIRMPGLDGVGAMQQVREGAVGPRACDTPIIAMTAEAAPGSAEKGLLAGFDAYLTKPFTKDGLLTVVGRFLPES